jgi:hypothetical protein
LARFRASFRLFSFVGAQRGTGGGMLLKVALLLLGLWLFGVLGPYEAGSLVHVLLLVGLMLLLLGALKARETAVRQERESRVEKR